MSSENKQVNESLNKMITILNKSKMNEIERDKLLHDAEVMCLKGKSNCKAENQKGSLYGASANAIHKDRSYLLSKIDKETMTGLCVCGRPIDICDEPIYCRYCGQRTSGTFGWTIGNYYNETK